MPISLSDDIAQDVNCGTLDSAAKPAYIASESQSPSHCSERDLVQRWLLTVDQSEAREVLEQVRIERPELFTGNGCCSEATYQNVDGRSYGEVMQIAKSGSVYGSERGIFTSQAFFSSMRGSLRVSTRVSEDGELAKLEPPIVQFSSAMFFCSAGESAVAIDVIRIGDPSGISKVKYQTRDNTAKAGARYVATSGTLEFKPGDREKTIEVQTLDSKIWDTTTEFIIELVYDDESHGCSLGRYLWMARVKVIDSNYFPSNKHSYLIDEGLNDNISTWALLIDYFKLNFHHPVVRRGTIKMMGIGLFHNLFFFQQLVLNVYLVDKILKGKVSRPLTELVLTSLSLLVPFFMLHVLEIRRLKWKIGGASRATLQKALIRKFLNYDEESRSELKRSDLVMAMTRDVPSLVHEGYVKAIGIAKSAGQMIVVLAFQVFAVIVFDQEFSSFPFMVFSVFPFLQVAFLSMRRAKTLRVVAYMNEMQDTLVAQVDRIVANYRMIADYNRRPFFVERFTQLVAAFNGARVDVNIALKQNMYFSQWITMLCIAGYTMSGGMHTIYSPETLSLGMFLANRKLISTIGNSMESIYQIVLDMQNTLPALRNIVSLLNLPTDVPRRMEVNRARRAISHQLRMELQRPEGLDIDFLPILVENLVYNYGQNYLSSTVHLPGMMDIKQGEMVTLMGPRGEGKSTILRLLGGVILPKPEGFFVPSHLRVLHISAEPLFFMGSLYDNLTFGVTSGDEDANSIRVGLIASRLGVPHHILSLIKQATMTAGDLASKRKRHISWGDVLSHTEQCLLSLARALVANPELLCVHKPTMPFDEVQSQKVLRLFREFCDCNGVEMEPKTRHKRRPRTCIITSSKLIGVNLSDRVFLVNKKEGINEIDVDDISPEMMSHEDDVLEPNVLQKDER